MNIERIRCGKCGLETVHVEMSETGTFYGYECDTCDDYVLSVIYEHFNGTDWEPF